MHIRDATLEDVHLLVEMHNAVIDEGTPDMDIRSKTAEDINERMETFSDRETYLIAELGNESIGFGLIKRYSPRNGYRFCAETSVYIRPLDRRQGYGTQLKQAVLERCKTYDYHHLLVRIWASNRGGVAFYQYMGYEIVGIQQEIGFIDGQWQDVVVMQLVL